MEIAIVILSFCTIMSIGLFLYYRRQVRLLCRHTAFIRTHQTNQILVTQLHFSELVQLTSEINRLLEREAERRLALQKQDRTLRETLIHLSHDIRTPLTSLNGYFQLMLQEETPAKERARYAQIIQERILDVKEMLEELFDYTKLQNVIYRLKLKSVDMNAVVCKAAVSFYQEFNRQHLEMNCDFTPELLPVYASEEALSRVFQNILKNALLYGNSQVTMRLYSEEKTAVFVCENDVAFPDAIDISKVFEQFYMADDARSLKGNSTGLGLAIAKGFILQMNGTIDAALTKNIFSIRITMPLLPKALSGA